MNSSTPREMTECDESERQITAYGPSADGPQYRPGVGVANEYADVSSTLAPHVWRCSPSAVPDDRPLRRRDTGYVLSDFPIGQQPAAPEDFCLLSQGRPPASERHSQRSTGYSGDTRSMKNVTFRGARGQRRHFSSSPDGSGRESAEDGSDKDYPRYRSPGIVRHSVSTVRKVDRLPF